MTVADAKAELVRAHREGGNVLRASIAFTRAKRIARRYAACIRCGCTIASKRYLPKRGAPRSPVASQQLCMLCSRLIRTGLANALNDV